MVIILLMIICFERKCNSRISRLFAPLKRVTSIRQGDVGQIKAATTCNPHYGAEVGSIKEIPEMKKSTSQDVMKPNEAERSRAKPGGRGLYCSVHGSSYRSLVVKTFTRSCIFFYYRTTVESLYNGHSPVKVKK